MKIFILLGIIFNLSCVSVNIELAPNSSDSTFFTYYSHYGIFGLIGSDTLNITQACMEGEPVQIRNYFSFEDFLFTITSVGLYSPKSTQIWCELPNKDSPIKL